MSEIDEMVAELEKLNLDDDASSVADSVEVDPVIVEVKKKSEPIKTAVIDDPVVTTPTEISKLAVPESNESVLVVDKPSFDGMISSVLARKRQLIDEEAAQKKQKAEERLYDNLFKIIELASSDAEPTKPSIPGVKPAAVSPVQSNVDAIALIDAEILNPKNKDLALLQKLKRQLQGIPEPKIVPENEKVKKHNVSNSVSGKVATAIIALFLVAGVSLSVGLKLMGVL